MFRDMVIQSCFIQEGPHSHTVCTSITWSTNVDDKIKPGGQPNQTDTLEIFYPSQARPCATALASLSYLQKLPAHIITFLVYSCSAGYPLYSWDDHSPIRIDHHYITSQPKESGAFFLVFENDTGCPPKWDLRQRLTELILSFNHMHAAGLASNNIF